MCARACRELVHWSCLNSHRWLMKVLCKAIQQKSLSLSQSLSLSLFIFVVLCPSTALYIVLSHTLLLLLLSHALCLFLSPLPILRSISLPLVLSSPSVSLPSIPLSLLSPRLLCLCLSPPLSPPLSLSLLGPQSTQNRQTSVKSPSLAAEPSVCWLGAAVVMHTAGFCSGSEIYRERTGLSRRWSGVVQTGGVLCLLSLLYARTPAQSFTHSQAQRRTHTHPDEPPTQ